VAEVADGEPAPLLYECKDVGIYGNVKNWAVNGEPGGTAAEGFVTPSSQEAGAAGFHAPDAVPGDNPVSVSVEYAGADPADHGLLIVPITIVEQGGACAALRDVSSWTANWGVSYAFSGTNPDGGTLTIDHGGSGTATLVKFSEGPSGVTFLGPLAGSVSVHDREVTPHPGSAPTVATLSGDGVPLVSAGSPTEKSYLSLSVNLVDCTYTTALRTWVHGTVTETGSDPFEGDFEVSVARTDARAIGSVTTAGLTGQTSAPAHSALWGTGHGGSAYFPGGMGAAIFANDYAAEGSAGSAQLSWSFTPVTH
jgi:hypothetical protein